MTIGEASSIRGVTSRISAVSAICCVSDLLCQRSAVSAICCVSDLLDVSVVNKQAVESQKLQRKWKIRDGN